MYTIYVKFKCLNNKRESFLEKMKETGILNAIRAEEGCVKYDYYLSDEAADEILLVEQWETKKHQQIHMTLPHMQQYLEFKDDYIISAEFGEIEIKG